MPERLEAGLDDPLVHSRLEHEELQRLDHRLDPEGAGLHGVLEEVGLEEPLSRVHVLDGPHLAEAGLARLGPEAVDAVEHQEHRSGEPRPARVEEGRRPRGEVDEEVARPLEELAVGVEDREPGLVRERGRREEAEDGLHLVDRPLSHGAGHLERLDDHRPGRRDAVQLHARRERAGVGEDLAEKRPGPVEIAEAELLVDAQRRADVAREPAARLERRLEEDGERHRPAAVLVEVPGVGRDVVLDGHRRARLHHADRAVDLRHAAHEEIRRPRKPGHARRARRTARRSARRPSTASPTRRRGGSPGRSGSRRPRPRAAGRRRPRRRAPASPRAASRERARSRPAARGTPSGRRPCRGGRRRASGPGPRRPPRRRPP